ncbi:MAG TPA: hypothetical protein VKU41_19410 [Polyangiaceae bacterium]|nr:hypothetical protein [Polyangiaceae bacterium]
MRSTLAFLPLAATGLLLVLSSTLDASAKDPPTQGASRSRRGSVRRDHTRKRHSSVNEGRLPDPIEGASCPREMALVDGRFCVDRWEGSLVEVMEDGSEQPWLAFRAVETGHRFRAVSRANVVPQGYISGAQAAAACTQAGKRLCAPVEWRTACEGPSQHTFGYGDERVAGRCNDEGRSPMLYYYPSFMSPSFAVGAKAMNDPRLNQLDGTVAATGS